LRLSPQEILKGRRPLKARRSAPCCKAPHPVHRLNRPFGSRSPAQRRIKRLQITRPRFAHETPALAAGRKRHRAGLKRSPFHPQPAGLPIIGQRSSPPLRHRSAIAQKAAAALKMGVSLELESPPGQGSGNRPTSAAFKAPERDTACRRLALKAKVLPRPGQCPIDMQPNERRIGKIKQRLCITAVCHNVQWPRQWTAHLDLHRGGGQPRDDRATKSAGTGENSRAAQPLRQAEDRDQAALKPTIARPAASAPGALSKGGDLIAHSKGSSRGAGLRIAMRRAAEGNSLIRQNIKQPSQNTARRTIGLQGPCAYVSALKGKQDIVRIRINPVRRKTKGRETVRVGGHRDGDLNLCRNAGHRFRKPQAIH
jgi:hypothetical protein